MYVHRKSRGVPRGTSHSASNTNNYQQTSSMFAETHTAAKPRFLAAERRENTATVSGRDKGAPRRTTVEHLWTGWVGNRRRDREEVDVKESGTREEGTRVREGAFFYRFSRGVYSMISPSRSASNEGSFLHDIHEAAEQPRGSVLGNGVTRGETRLGLIRTCPDEIGIIVSRRRITGDRNHSESIMMFRFFEAIRVNTLPPSPFFPFNEAPFIRRDARGSLQVQFRICRFTRGRFRRFRFSRSLIALVLLKSRDLPTAKGSDCFRRRGRNR